MKKHIAKLLAVLLVSALSVVISACGPDIAAQPVIRQVETATISQPEVISVRGLVESTESRNVYSTLGLKVERVYVEDGDIVRAGQILAVLCTGDLELAVAQQVSALEATRRNAENAVRETRRMLSEAEANLARNTNMHILSAEAAFNGAAVNLEITQQNYDNAMRDYLYRSSPHIIAAESALTAIRTELDALEVTYASIKLLYTYGDVSREEFRQVETGITHLRNQYNDATRALETALDQEQRAIQQLRTALQSAVTARQNARQLLTAAGSAANQEVEMLRSSVIAAELASNLEPMEIAIQLMERQLEDAIITAPIDGTITARIAREGGIGMGLMFVVEDTSNLRVITGFREYDIAYLSQGMKVSIVPDGAAGTYAGIISRISTNTSPFFPVPTFEAEISVTSEDTDLRIGMTTRIDVHLITDGEPFSDSPPLEGLPSCDANLTVYTKHGSIPSTQFCG